MTATADEAVEDALEEDIDIFDDDIIDEAATDDDRELDAIDAIIEETVIEDAAILATLDDMAADDGALDEVVVLGESLLPPQALSMIVMLTAKPQVMKLRTDMNSSPKPIESCDGPDDVKRSL